MFRGVSQWWGSVDGDLCGEIWRFLWAEDKGGL